MRETRRRRGRPSPARLGDEGRRFAEVSRVSPPPTRAALARARVQACLGEGWVGGREGMRQRGRCDVHSSMFTRYLSAPPPPPPHEGEGNYSSKIFQIPFAETTMRPSTNILTSM